MRIRSPVLIPAAVAVLLASPALATPSPLTASVSVNASDNGSPAVTLFDKSASSHSGTVAVTGASGTITGKATSIPKAAAVFAATSVGDPGFAVSTATLSYDFQIVSSGDPYAGLAPVLISGLASVSGTSGAGFAGGSDDRADVLVAPETGGPAYLHAHLRCIEESICFEGGVDSETELLNTVAFIPVGDLTLVSLSASSFGINFGLGSRGYGGTAFVDPSFSILPSFLADHPGFSLQFSPGAGNPAVPEPGAWAFMLAGFLAVGAMARRRRARATPTQA